MRELGLFGVTIPEAYGGLGLDLLTYIGSSRSWPTAG
jgi:alkylation response protein AidB-like acyl-CoA dehydrogenase